MYPALEVGLIGNSWRWCCPGHARSAIVDPQGSDLQLGRDGGLSASQLQEVVPAVGTPDPDGEVKREPINLDRFLGLLDASSTKKVSVFLRAVP